MLNLTPRDHLRKTQAAAPVSLDESGGDEPSFLGYDNEAFSLNDLASKISFHQVSAVDGDREEEDREEEEATHLEDAMWLVLNFFKDL